MFPSLTSMSGALQLDLELIRFGRVKAQPGNILASHFSLGLGVVLEVNRFVCGFLCTFCYVCVRGSCGSVQETSRTVYIYSVVNASRLCVSDVQHLHQESCRVVRDHTHESHLREVNRDPARRPMQVGSSANRGHPSSVVECPILDREIPGSNAVCCCFDACAFSLSP